jgi:dihydroorotate dehydrogenase electron transfer subunit
VKQLKAPVISCQEVMPDTRLFWLDAPEIAAEAKPGQFVMVSCGEDTVLPRPFSVHRVDSNRLALLICAIGLGTRWLFQIKKDDNLDIFGPLGNGYSVIPKTKNLLLVAGGMGIAPLYYLAETAVGQGKKVTLIQGGRTRAGILPVSLTQQYYEKGLPPAGLNVITATEDGTEGFKGLATQLIPHYLRGTDQVFACGPAAMYRTMAAMPELKNIPVQLSLEIVMGCGAGICYGCTIKTKKGLRQVCKDGPVFEMGEVEWGNDNHGSIHR